MTIQGRSERSNRFQTRGARTLTRTNREKTRSIGYDNKPLIPRKLTARTLAKINSSRYIYYVWIVAPIEEIEGIRGEIRLDGSAVFDDNDAARPTFTERAWARTPVGE